MAETSLAFENKTSFVEATPIVDSDTFAKVAGVITSHVFVVKKHQEGTERLLNQHSGDTIAIVACRTNRSDPSLEMENIRLLPGKSYVVSGANGAGKSTFFDVLCNERGGAQISLKDSATSCFQFGTSTRFPKLRPDSLVVARLNQEEQFTELADIPAREVLAAIKEYYTQVYDSSGDYADWQNPQAQELAEEKDQATLSSEQLFNKTLKAFEAEYLLNTSVPCGQLSGGERTKVSLLMLAMSEPDVILADEPTNHLDLSGASTLQGYFNTICQEGGSVSTATHVGWFKYVVGTDGVFAVSLDKTSGRRTVMLHPTSYADFMANPNIVPVRVLQTAIEWWQHYDRKNGQSIYTGEKNASIPNSPIKNQDLPGISGGEFLVLSGKNGTGKTRLMNYMRTHAEADCNIAYLPQFWPEELQDATVEEFFSWVKSSINDRISGAPGNPHLAPEAAFSRRLKEVSFAGKSATTLMHTKLTEFSGGEQRLLWFLAMGSIANIDLLLLDEPTNHMDEYSMKLITDTLLDFDGAVVVSSHDLDFMKRISGLGIDATRRRPITHYSLERSGDQTVIQKQDLTPAEYAQRCKQEGIRAGSRIKKNLMFRRRMHGLPGHMFQPPY